MSGAYLAWSCGFNAEAEQGLVDIGARLDEHGLYPSCPGTVDVLWGVIEEQELRDLKSTSLRDDGERLRIGLAEPEVRRDENGTKDR
jgi:hypothetical protein